MLYKGSAPMMMTSKMWDFLFVKKTKAEIHIKNLEMVSGFKKKRRRKKAPTILLGGHMSRDFVAEITIIGPSYSEEQKRTSVFWKTRI